MSEILFEKLEACGKLPTPPAVVVKLLDLTRKPDVSIREVADTLALDPVLAAKILRFVNSPMSGVTRKVTSLQQAAALMGIRSVKMMALSFAVMDSASAKPCDGFDAKQFVVQSMCCGIAARRLSETCKLESPQDSFLAGLLSQIGRSVLASAEPDQYAKLLSKAKHIPEDLPPLEQVAFSTDYTIIGSQLLQKWGIPPAICRAVEIFHHSDAWNEKDSLARILNVAETTSSVMCPSGCGDPTPISEYTDRASTHFQIKEDEATALLKLISGDLDDARIALELPEGNIRSVDALEGEIRERITELGIAMHLENQQLVQRQEDLVRRAVTDPLTGIGNRAAFDQQMASTLERAAREHSPFALFMIDVDHFKSFNDRYGHQAGDRVLETIAHAIDENIHKVDFVARYGGEEFAVIVPATPVDEVARLAERLRRVVETAPCDWYGDVLHVAISIGVATFEEIADSHDAPAIIRAADEQLYAAKSAGRNQVKMLSATSPKTMVDLPR